MPKKAIALALSITAIIFCVSNIDKRVSAEYDEALADVTETTNIEVEIPAATEESQSEKLAVLDGAPEIAHSNSTTNKAAGMDFSLKRLIVQTNDYDALTKYGAKITSLLKGFYTLEFSSEEATRNAFLELSDLESIKAVDPDVSVNLSSISSDQYAWGVENIGADHYTDWLKVTSNDTTVKISVIDSGINQNHIAFKNSDNVNDRIIITPSTKDYVNGDDDPDDENGHGTSVAGVIVESTPANVKIYPSKVFDATGKTDSTGLTNVLTAITNAVNEDKVDIINLSLGFDSEDESDIIKCSDYSAVENFFTQVKNAGVLTIAAAGNESHAVSFPANCTDVIAVSSVKSDRTFSSDFSNFGPEIDFAMPGERLYLPTIIKAGEAVPDPSINSNNALRQISGTSFSSPFLASAAALIKAENPNYTPAQLIVALKSYAVSLGEANKYGNGIVDFGEKMFKNARVYMKSEKTVGSSSDNLWTKSGTIKVAAVSSSPITKYAFGKTEAALLNSSNIHNVTGTQYTLPVTDITVTEAHRYYFGVTNATSTSTTYVDVGNIDNTAPTFESKITFSNAGANKITVSVYALDSQSGIKKYSIYYRKKGTTTYENKSFAYALVGNAGTTSQVLASLNLTNLEDATEYEFYFEVEDAVGNKRTTELATFTTQTTDPIQLPDAGGNENQQPQNPDPEAVRTSASNPVTVDPIIIYFSGFVGSTMLGFAIYRTIGGRR